MNDVFLSFRGEDTRTNFISHLYKALYKKPVNAFIDDNLKRGEDVWPALSKAIEESHISVVVFSENYAYSKWCLEELVKILECRKDHGQVVMPVFYETDPSDIRKQAGTYETAFAKHERDLRVEDSESNKQKVLKWRAALSEAANISGWDSRNHKDDSQLIDNVVKDVTQMLHPSYPIKLEGIVRSGKKCKKVESLMKKHQVIGIWGMPGVGKTTIAKVLFAKFFLQYDNICFVANAKEVSLDKILSELLKEEISASNVLGTTFITRRLSGKKVFIVLDDVDSYDLLEDLRRAYSHLSQDSRLIITTRDKQLLARRVDYIYKVKNWKTTESLKLFSLEAFNQSRPQNGYLHLSKRAVDYAGGVPFALKFLGSYLRSKSIEFWESTLRKINNYNIVKIQNLLEVSYDELDGLEKKIFLDIAFFFIGKMKDHVTKILDACDFEASSGIEVLEDRALITISHSNIIQMHDLLQKMALEIVRMEDEENPEGRSRLRHSEAHDVIEKNKGTKAIQGITLDLSQITALPLRADTFTKMEALRFLKFCNPLDQSSSNTYVKLPTVLEPFCDKLRYVEWIGYPFESLPHLFSAKLLVEIRMPHSNAKQLWQGTQELDNLEGIDLSECKKFENLPDLSKASRLKWVNLSGCESLRDLHHSLLSTDTLVTLILDRCINLKSVKGKKHLKSLQTISVNGCLSLQEFAVSWDLIENLDLRNTGTGIQRLGTSIGLLHNWPNLEGLRLTHLKSLKELKLSCSGLVIDKKQLSDLFDGLRSLQILHLKQCSYLFEVPDNIRVLSQLQELKLDGSNVISLPTSIKYLERLEILSLENCRKLKCLPELPPSIKQLNADNCESLMFVSNLKGLESESGRSVTLTSIEGSYEKESNGSSEQSFSDETDSDSEIEMVEPDSAEEGNDGRKEHYSNEEESTKSTRNRLVSKENTAVSAVKSERNKPYGLHEPAELPLDKENESKEKSTVAIELESVQKDKERRDHFSRVKESIGSTHNEMKTGPGRGIKENTTKSTKVVKSEGNKATTAEPGARLHELIKSQPDKENASMNKSIFMDVTLCFLSRFFVPLHYFTTFGVSSFLPLAWLIEICEARGKQNIRGRLAFKYLSLAQSNKVDDSRMIKDWVYPLNLA
ncbi:disease resistance protein RPV1-like [Gastrolobium bilobum]|uniref:disease resistance protein RPV1-like n=1 Tax=Gastrolobium bilobum TaxID=150636 RepID=UPI002AAFC209|nr:disease resistance protein RPV1-like [Gastrolobium bilobum]